MTIVGLDGDILGYELAYVAVLEEEVFGIKNIRPWPTSAVNQLVDNRVQGIIERSGADGFEVFLTGANNFRMDLATIAPYKGTRHPEKPHHWSTVRDRLKEHWGATEVCGIEADDMLAIRGTEVHKQQPGSYIIASRDKDLRQVNCLHYAWKCGEHQPEIPTYGIEGIGEISYKKDSSGGYKLLGNGPRFLWAQVLTGDNIDNIKGCKGVGAKGAVEALGHLETEADLFFACCYKYQQKYPEWLEVLKENVRLLWLIQDRDMIDIHTLEDEKMHIKVNRLWDIPDSFKEDPRWNPLINGEEITHEARPILPTEAEGTPWD